MDVTFRDYIVGSTIRIPLFSKTTADCTRCDTVMFSTFFSLFLSHRPGDHRTRCGASLRACLSSYSFFGYVYGDIATLIGFDFYLFRYYQVTTKAVERWGTQKFRFYFLFPEG